MAVFLPLAFHCKLKPHEFLTVIYLLLHNSKKSLYLIGRQYARGLIAQGIGHYQPGKGRKPFNSDFDSSIISSIYFRSTTMTVNSISSNNNWVSQLNSFQQNHGKSIGQNGGGQPPGPPPELMNAVSQALSQIGIGSDSSTSSTSGATSTSTSLTTSSGNSTQDAGQALASFMQSLMKALHSQSSGQGSGSDSDGDNDASQGIKAQSGDKPNLQADLKSLIQQLASNSASSSGSVSASSSLSELQTSFNNLESAIGGSSGNSATLTDFLQAFSGNLQNTNRTGGLINTSA